MATYILFWNPAISSYNERHFVADFDANYGVENWSIYEYKEVQPGDTFYMVRCGEGNVGVAMRGIIDSMSWNASDWSSKGRKNIYYVDLIVSFSVNTFETDRLLSPDILTREMPDFNWYGGHSGRRLSDEYAERLDDIFFEYTKENADLFAKGLAKWLPAGFVD